MPRMDVRPAISRSDLADCLALRAEAERWLADHDIQQWTNTNTGKAGLADAFANRTLHVVTSENEIVACFALGDADLDFWSPAEAEHPAQYLYKLIIRQDHRGTGLGDALLDHACILTTARQAKTLRIDVWKSNLALQAYYLRRGFAHYGTRTAPGRWSGWLAERPAAHRTYRGSIRLHPQPNL